MNPDELTDDLRNWIDSVTHVSWLGTAVALLVILIVTAVVAHLVTLLLKRILKADNGPLPSVSIFINIGRTTVWIIGVSIALSSCFNVDVGAAVTALGIGGIAISLGFQDTLSNLIGGLQIIMIGLVEPGDHIKVSNHEGVVHDVTWRHTTIITARGERVVIPNSVINTEALIKLPPETEIRIDIVISPSEGESLKEVITTMEKSVEKAVSKITALQKRPKISLIYKEAMGYGGLLTFVVGKGPKKAVVVDTALKALGPEAKRVSAPREPRTRVQKLEARKEQRRREKKEAEKERAKRRVKVAKVKNRPSEETDSSKPST